MVFPMRSQDAGSFSQQTIPTGVTRVTRVTRVPLPSRFASKRPQGDVGKRMPGQVNARRFECQRVGKSKSFS